MSHNMAGGPKMYLISFSFSFLFFSFLPFLLFLSSPLLSSPLLSSPLLSSPLLSSPLLNDYIISALFPLFYTPMTPPPSCSTNKKMSKMSSHTPFLMSTNTTPSELTPFRLKRSTFLMSRQDSTEVCVYVCAVVCMCVCSCHRRLCCCSNNSWTSWIGICLCLLLR